MKAGLIGAGRVGFSLGKYLKESGVPVAGYCDRIPACAVEAAAFTDTVCYPAPDALVQASDILFLTTQDAAIGEAWESIRHLPLRGKVICHCSGSMTSDVFEGIDETGAHGCSLHPMLAFSDKYSSWQQLAGAFFTAEGDPDAVRCVKGIFEPLGNRVCPMEAEKKVKYHAAASILSNQVVAVLNAGYGLLMECGFSEEEARMASGRLVRGNMEHVIGQGPVAALTGPIERGDLTTVKKHLDCLDGTDKEMYRVLGQKLVEIAKKKNPERDYAEMEKLLLQEEE